MGKTVLMIVGVVAAVAIAVAAPYLAPLALGALGITASATAIAIATGVITAVLSIGLSLAFRALGVGAPSSKSAVGPPQVFRQSISNSFIVYGERRVGGLLVFFHPRTSGSDYYRYFVIACAGHRCRGVVTWMLGDEAVTVDGAGMVTSGKYASAAWLWFQLGLASETANATFVSECSGKWTTAHKGNSTAAIYAKFKMTDDVVQAGMPNITAVIEGRDEIYDPRGPTTDYSKNPALIFYDWLTIPREEGGFGAYADEIPDAAWINAQANVCDETVSSEARYELHAVIQTGAAPNEIRDVMIVNQAGSYTYSGGKHVMRPGYWVPSSATLSEDDLAGAIQVSPFFPADVAANEVQGTFVNPADNYQAAPFVTQRLASPPTDVRQIDLDLAFTTSPHQAERVARIMLERAQREKTVVWPMNIAGLKVKALDTVQLDSARYGLSNYAWAVNDWSLSADYGVMLTVREEDEAIYTDPTPSTITTPPTITPADPVMTQAEIISLIQDSWVTGLTFSIADTGAVTISTHSRVYRDKTVSITGTGGTPHATSATAAQVVYIYYDDPDRAGGAVTYHHLVLPSTGGDSSSAYCSPTYPYRHLVCAGVVPATGGTTSGGSDTGSGGGTVPVGCPVEETPVLLANAARDGPGETLAIGDDRVAVGGCVWTRHPASGEWGAYPITHKRRDYRPVLRAPGLPRATADHPFDLGLTGEWTRMEALGVGDGWAWTILLTVAEAHSYFTPGGGDIRPDGVLNHNKAAVGLE